MKNRFTNHCPEETVPSLIAFVICIPFTILLASCSGSSLASGNSGLLPVVLTLLAVIAACIPFIKLHRDYMIMYHDWAQSITDQQEEQEEEPTQKEQKDNNGIEPGPR